MHNIRHTHTHTHASTQTPFQYIEKAKWKREEEENGREFRIEAAGYKKKKTNSHRLNTFSHTDFNSYTICNCNLVNVNS